MKRILQLSVIAAFAALAVPAFPQGAIEFSQQRGSHKVIPQPDQVLGFDHNTGIIAKGAGVGQVLKIASDKTTASSAANLTELAFKIPAHKIAHVEALLIGAQAATAYGAVINIPTVTGVTGSNGALVSIPNTDAAQTRKLYTTRAFLENTTGAEVTITPTLIRGAGSTAESTVKAGSLINIVIFP